MSPSVSTGARPRTRILAWTAGFVAVASIAIYALRQPQQSVLLLGLIAAALIIALKDLLLSILGWYIIKGRKGIRVGDLVEIDGIQGEIIEITVLRTTLLETGNWTTAGRPTGRHAIFLNNFPFRHKFINLTTSQQWMWDQLSIAIPYDAEFTSDTLHRIQRLVLRKTHEDAAEAEEAWKRLSQINTLTDYSAAPPVVLRPSASGNELIVRYIVQAHDRFATSTQLRDQILAVLTPVHEPAHGHVHHHFTHAPFISSLAALDPNVDDSEIETPHITH